MGIDAALADQFEIRQALQQRGADLRSLADQHQRFGIAQPFRQHIDVLDVIVPNLDVMPHELLETVEGAYGVEIIIEHGDLHDTHPSLQQLKRYFTASSSTSNIKVAFGGITPPAPRAP